MRRKGVKGFTLIEVTIILLVLVILSGILLPALERFIDLAKYVKVKEDVGMIAAIIELWKLENCHPWFQTDPVNLTDTGRVDTLISNGNIPATTGLAGYDLTGWIQDSGPDTGDVITDTMDNQLVLGDPGGVIPNNAPGFGGPYPRPTKPFECGFRGAYISAPVTADPWSNRYAVNVAFLGPPGSGGRLLGTPTPIIFRHQDVFVISAGPDGVLETGFVTDGVVAVGDDQIAVVSGGAM